MRGIQYFFILLIFCLVPVSSHAAQSDCRILVVMSYHDGYPWQDEQRRGILESIGKKCELAFFNLDSIAVALRQS
ncbi:MAG TPA: hypothetical protein VLH56_14850 [Dissulfurispiraceae bacterium]|nr:hypothetical protein [Dissulfurispiraceae bacterium]